MSFTKHFALGWVDQLSRTKDQQIYNMPTICPGLWQKVIFQTNPTLYLLLSMLLCKLWKLQFIWTTWKPVDETLLVTSSWLVWVPAACTNKFRLSRASFTSIVVFHLFLSSFSEEYNTNEKKCPGCIIHLVNLQIFIDD